MKPRDENVCLSCHHKNRLFSVKKCTKCGTELKKHDEKENKKNGMNNKI